MDDDHLPGIRQVSAIVRWMIELQIVIAVPALMLSAIAIVASELSGGSQLSSDPTFQQITSYTQAIGIEGAFFSIVIQARRAMHKSNHGRGVFMILIGILLGTVTMLAMVAGNFESAFGLDTAAALTALGINATVWAWARAAVYFIVSFADAYMFYVPKPKLTEDQVRAQIEQERLSATLEQERAKIGGDKLRNRLAVGRGVFAQAIGRGEAYATPTSPDGAESPPPQIGQPLPEGDAFVELVNAIHQHLQDTPQESRPQAIATAIAAQGYVEPPLTDVAGALVTIATRILERHDANVEPTPVQMAEPSPAQTHQQGTSEQQPPLTDIVTEMARQLAEIQAQQAANSALLTAPVSQVNPTVTTNAERDDRPAEEEKRPEQFNEVTSTSPAGRARQQPADPKTLKPGTKAFTEAVRGQIGAIESTGIKATVAEVASRMNETEANVAPAFASIMNKRQKR
jgi:hypothetical protein